MKTLNDIRKSLKPLGFGVRTRKGSEFNYATYYHVESAEDLTYNVFTPETLAKWAPLFNWRKEHAQELDGIRRDLYLVGLK